MRDATARRLSALHTLAYRVTGGRIGRRLVNNDMLLVTTRGRHSGREHTVPLLYLSDDDGVVVIASWGGRDYPPHWYLNMKAESEVSVQVNGRRWMATAIELDEPERSEWWERAIAAYDGYAEYQARTQRLIPILRLAPTE
ncbi:MAG: nitroreductase family deazaflavin-dependent oxidoreductase [bacterium]|nr:nitroreductase family deazaflavin-dependent oxidoreductase [bacterium]